MNEKEFGEFKDDVIQSILAEEDLYKILGADRSASAAELRKCYLERSKICHPDKLPFHPLSTSAFQRLAFAFEILKSPSSRATYDRVATPSTDALPTKTSFLGADHTFLSAVSSLLHDFITGDFILIRSFLLSLHTQYPNLVNKDIMTQVETGFWRTREIVMWGRGWALIVLGEMGRVAKVQRELGELGRWDVVGRVRGMVRLVRVVVAVPVRVDRKVRERGEKEWRARRAGLEARGEAEVEEWRRGGILNERVFKVLEFIVGEAGRDEEEDRAGQGVRTWM